MKVHYGKRKKPIDFGVGGVIVAMVTIFFSRNSKDFLVSALSAAVLVGSSLNLV